MKSFKYIATLTLAIAGLATQADAIPITYSYVGTNFTVATGPAGFTTSDNITASFTVNNSLAPNMTFDLASIGATMRTISNGVFTNHDFVGFVTTDAAGNIVSWGLTREESQPDDSLVRLESVNDINLFVEDSARQFLLDMSENHGLSFVPGTWSSGPASVPEEGATLSMICLALITLLGFKYANFRGVYWHAN